MKPVLLDPAKVRPRVNDDACVCSKCGQKRARWYALSEARADGAEAWLTMCSLCWLYASPWGTENADGLAELIDATERQLGRVFTKYGGKLSSHADTDRILSSISLTSRIFQAADRRQGG